jgi:hypothetical protein
MESVETKCLKGTTLLPGEAALQAIRFFQIFTRCTASQFRSGMPLLAFHAASPGLRLVYFKAVYIVSNLVYSIRNGWAVQLLYTERTVPQCQILTAHS